MVAKLRIIVKACSRVLHISADKLILSNRGVFLITVFLLLVAFLVYVFND